MKKLLILLILNLTCCIIIFSGCNKENYNAPLANDVYDVNILGDSVTADGIDYYKVRVSFKDTSMLKGNTSAVSFSSMPAVTINVVNSGKFDQSGNAYAEFSYNKSGEVNISCTLNSLSKNEIITFYPSVADLMTIKASPSVFSFNNKSYLTFDMTASFSKKNTGAISDYPTSFFQVEAMDTIGNSQGSFINPSVDPVNHNLSISFFLQDSTFRGFLNLEAKCLSGSDTLVGSYSVFITK